jgi:hypothetical protein
MEFKATVVTPHQNNLTHIAQKEAARVRVSHKGEGEASDTDNVFAKVVYEQFLKSPYRTSPPNAKAYTDPSSIGPSSVPYYPTQTHQKDPPPYARHWTCIHPNVIVPPTSLTRPQDPILAPSPSPCPSHLQKSLRTPNTRSQEPRQEHMIVWPAELRLTTTVPTTCVTGPSMHV